jgi:hypothetical protein
MNENIIFCRILLGSIRPEVEAAGHKVNKDAWVFGHGHGHWEFHGPDGFYDGTISADNAYDARYKGWTHFLEKEGEQA